MKTKEIKKKLVLLLAASLGAMSLVGCGTAESGSVTADASVITTEKEDSTSGKTGEVPESSEKTGTAETTGATETSETKELITVRLATASASAEAALTENARLAQDLGYFDEELEKAGYKIEYIGFAGAGPAINEAFAAKEIEYAFYAELPIYVANSNGVGITGLATANNQFGYAVLATEASGIKSGADLAGKKVIAPYGTILYKYLLEILEAYNIPLEEVEIINSQTDAAALLASGEADAILSTYGGALLYASYGLGSVVDNTTDGPGNGGGLVLAGRSDFVSENPEANKAILRALYRAYQFVQENPEEVYTRLASEANPEAVIRQTYAFDGTFSYFNPILTDDYLERASKIYDFAADNQLLGANEISVDKIFDRSYGEEVEQEFK